jgi:hypothetical protein
VDVHSWYVPAAASAGDAHVVRRLAFAQHGVARRGQLRAAGLSDGQIDHAVRFGNWQEIAGVVVLHNGELTTAQREEVATRVGVRLVALAARTAAERAGLTGWPAPALEVVTLKGSTYPPLPFAVRLHESRRLVVSDVVDVSPARVRIERALVDAAAWAAADKVACGLLAAGVQQRLTTPERLEAQMSLSGQVHRKRLLSAVLTDICGGAQALSEVAFAGYCRRRGLPKPELQAVRLDASGRRRYLDAGFRRRDGSLLAVEIDGALHLLAATYWSDMNRGNELVIAGTDTLRFPSWLIHADDPRVAEQIRRALGLSVLDGPSLA